MDNLRMFCRVVEEGSISEAARQEYVSQPAVTKQIRHLENSYETTLFDRENGKLLLNETGNLLYTYAKEILALNKIAYEAIQEHLGKAEKTLYVGASLTIGEYLLPRLIGRFKKRHPDMKFSLSIGNTPLMLHKLEKNEIDIALVESIFQHDQFKKQIFAEDELILVTSKGHLWEKRDGINVKEMSNEQMIWREKESGMRMIVEKALREQNVLEYIENAMELGSMQAIKSAVEAGLGISILPKLVVEKELKYNMLQEIPIENFQLTRDFWMVQKQRRFKKEAEVHFERFIMG